MVQDTMNGLIQELRRGTIILSVLSQLSEPQYGYSLIGILEDKGVQIDPGTLYPLLRRLEKQELLESHWETSESRPRKYYLLSAQGKLVYRLLCEEWRKIASGMDRLIGGGSEDDSNRID